MEYVMLAYGAVWLAVAAYLGWIAVAMTRLERRVERLERGV